MIAITLHDYLNEQKTNLNSNFKKWFGKSKIVDSNGKPLVVYHGTNSEFNSFDDRKKGSTTDSGMRGRGFYFSNSMASSQAYGKIVQSVYLKVENPFDLLSYKSLDEIAEALDIDSGILNQRGAGLSYPQRSISVNSQYSGVFSGQVRDKGFDGILHGQEIVVFKSEQIKSIDNDGSWDNNDSNIFS